MIQYQILQIDIIRIVWQTVGRITNEILGVKGLKQTFVHIKALIHGMFLFNNLFAHHNTCEFHLHEQGLRRMF